MSSVTVYSRENCVQCKATYRALEKKGVKYRVVDVGTDLDAAEKVRKMGYMQAPVVETPLGHWSGFRPDRIEELAAL